ncbi:hypothetical protein TREES_T100014833 [Tupaia chinensis]|uniref:Uncharacterized protein n=1 Tax=Tupaia chinensis TaxID=246437 RepID=L9KT23_TUPCH|nr:hypothetical protein TREES_T100014833 [Tupaia chinensis]
MKSTKHYVGVAFAFDRQDNCEHRYCLTPDQPPSGDAKMESTWVHPPPVKMPRWSPRGPWLKATRPVQNALSRDGGTAGGAEEEAPGGQGSSHLLREAEHRLWDQVVQAHEGEDLPRPPEGQCHFRAPHWAQLLSLPGVGSPIKGVPSTGPSHIGPFAGRAPTEWHPGLPVIAVRPGGRAEFLKAETRMSGPMFTRGQGTRAPVPCVLLSPVEDQGAAREVQPLPYKR